MRYVLENDILRVEIDSQGAELKSVVNKATGQEYMWQGDPTYWKRTSPILFPFVGKLKNDSYLHGGQTYSMTKHGFARDMEHNFISKDSNSIQFKLVTNEETLECFPFSFTLNIGYELDGNEVKVLWEVRNNSRDKHMHFSIGAHPAFNCPIHGEDNKEGYRLYFKDAEEIRYHCNSETTGLATAEEYIFPLNDHRITITPDFFDRCTYIVEGQQTKAVGLEDPQGNRIVTVLFDMPLFGLWTPTDTPAPFVCISPWYGRGDDEDFEGTLKSRAYDNVLQGGEKFNASYIMRFGA